MILYLIFNSFIVFGLNKYYNMDIELTSRISSVINALVSLVGSVLFLGNMITYNVLNEVVKYNVVYISTDIYLYFAKLIDSVDIKEMMVHHMCFLIGSYLAYKQPVFYAYGIMSEGSTIFLNTRWFAIKKYYFRNIELHSLLLWLTFLGFRIINMTNLAFLMYSINYYYIILVLPFIILNYVWFYYLSLKVVKLLNKIIK
jgi:hypothetical protein